jgi:AAA+ superfamily predicted ATPase
MNDWTRRLLRAVANKDMKDARFAALQVCKADKTKANEAFCAHIKRDLESPAAKMAELPSDVRGLLIAEDTDITFNPARYYLSNRERAVKDRILMLRKASETLKKVGVNYLNATMFYGPSGTGKTIFGRYVAHATGLPYVYINLTKFIDSHMGNTSKNIGRTFEFVQETPCVLMLDEFDAIAESRSGHTGMDAGKEMARVTISLMQAMDGLSSDAILLAATNRPDLIDDAVLRRFTIKHEFKIFTPEEIREMLERQIKDIAAFDAFPMNISMDALREYCEKSPTQSEAVADLVFALAESILTGGEIIIKTKACDDDA